jgi:hypothetical protein
VALLQLKKQALIIDLIHYLDVIDQLEKLVLSVLPAVMAAVYCCGEGITLCPVE